MKLYYLPTCPHCHKVIGWIEAHNLQDNFTFVDVSASEEAAAELQEVSDQNGVPCLLLPDGQTIVGDTPIISFLSENYA